MSSQRPQNPTPPRKEREENDFSHEVNPVGSKALRWTLIVLGTAFVALGVAGIFLPLLPTTPFLLLAAACYARASKRFYNALMSHPWTGPSLRAWRQHRSMPRKARRNAAIAVVVTFSISIAIVPVMWVKGLLVCICAGLLFFFWRMPVLPDEAAPTAPKDP